VEIRQATTGDVEALVRLRVANAEAHLALDPAAYRVPDRHAVSEHFTAAVSTDLVLIALIGGRAVGMVEVLRTPDPPEHQILQPKASAQVHTVVLPEARGHGVGAALLAAARELASDHGVQYLSAGIHHANEGAVRFYRRHGFTPSGLSLGLGLA
jgi:GNAT superfamily N-acetyltransferase